MPEIQHYPVLPDVRRNLFYGRFMGLMFFQLLALLVIFLLNREESATENLFESESELAEERDDESDWLR